MKQVLVLILTLIWGIVLIVHFGALLIFWQAMTQFKPLWRWLGKGLLILYGIIVLLITLKQLLKSIYQ